MKLTFPVFNLSLILAITFPFDLPWASSVKCDKPLSDNLFDFYTISNYKYEPNTLNLKCVCVWSNQYANNLVNSIEQFLWTTPSPPSLAIAMAMSSSVTVSIAALMIGILSLISFVRRVSIIVYFGKIFDFWGTNKN